MDSLLTLLTLSLVMGIASFLAGSLPLTLPLSQSQLRLISTIGMGVLVGTSLIVIIPEGVETLYSSTSIGHLHTRSTPIHHTFDMRWTEISRKSAPIYDLTPRGYGDLSDPTVDGPEFEPALAPGPVLPANIKEPPKTPTEPGTVGVMGGDGNEEEDTQIEEGQGHEEEHQEHSPHAWIGVALISGFLLMFLVDKLPQHALPAKARSKTHHIALNNLGRRFNLTTSLDRDEEEGFLDGVGGVNARERSFATTIGLVIHAAADGIALGASSSTSNSELSLIIFFAIMIHKAPAAFGLTSVLLKQGLSKKTARGHLLLFSMAAPSGAVLTWLLAHILGAFGGSGRNTPFYTGFLLLFSGGTFLYVAVHAMQETTSQHDPVMNGHTNGYIDGREAHAQETRPSLRDLIAACCGMLLPLFLQIWHLH